MDPFCRFKTNTKLDSFKRHRIVIILKVYFTIYAVGAIQFVLIRV